MRYHVAMTTLSVDAVLFDLDGTLVDSIDLVVDCFTHACRTLLGTAPDREWIVGTIGRPLAAALEDAAPGCGAELLDAYRTYHDLHHDRLLRPYPAALEVLRALHARGLPLGIVSSKRRHAVMQALELYELVPLFQTIITPEDTTRHKPEPDPLLEGAARLGLPPGRVLYVGDSTYDVLAAQAAGMPVAAALWGAGVAPALRALAPDLVLREPRELLAAIDT